jgi:hypothetical protein
LQAVSERAAASGSFFSKAVPVLASPEAVGAHDRNPNSIVQQYKSLINHGSNGEPLRACDDSQNKNTDEAERLLIQADIDFPSNTVILDGYSTASICLHH